MSRSDKVAAQPVKFINVDVRPTTQRDDKDVDKSSVESEELVLRIIRDADIGLGVSVAGGVGTTAFKPGDEVAICVLL